MQLTQNTYFGEGNRYYLEKLLGRGGFSEVWLAKDTITDLELVLKVYAPGTGMDEDGLQTFSKELARVYNLNHQNLLKPQHVDTWENMPYLIMAYCAQGSCASRLGKMSEQEMWKFIHDVAAGLAYLHEKEVVHQDIKPDNILIDDAGNYLITDFGVSTRARSTLRKSVVSSSARGTTAYMGPERFSRQPAPTKASDIWSFGVMCYELLDGQVPFGEIGGGMQKSGAEIPALQAHVSDALKYTITKMLQKETWDRPTAATLVEWAKNPSCIEIDYALLEEEPAPAAPQPSQPKQDNHATQRFKTPITTKSQDTQLLDTQPTEETQDALKISLYPTNIQVPAEGGKVEVYVSSNSTYWTIKELPKWVHLDKKTDNKFIIRFEKNDSGKPRECTKEVAAYSIGQTICAKFSISQSPLTNGSSLAATTFYSPTAEDMVAGNSASSTVPTVPMANTKELPRNYQGTTKDASTSSFLILLKKCVVCLLSLIAYIYFFCVLGGYIVCSWLFLVFATIGLFAFEGTFFTRLLGLTMAINACVPYLFMRKKVLMTKKSLYVYIGSSMITIVCLIVWNFCNYGDFRYEMWEIFSPLYIAIILGVTLLSLPTFLWCEKEGKTYLSWIQSNLPNWMLQ